MVEGLYLGSEAISPLLLPDHRSSTVFSYLIPKELRLAFHFERRPLLLYLMVDVDTKLAVSGAFWGFMDVTALTADTEDSLYGSSGVSGLASGQRF